MTKKDYQLIARALCDARMPCSGPNTGTNHLAVTHNIVVDETVRHVATALATDNPRFDKQRFLDACAYMKGSGS